MSCQLTAREVLQECLQVDGGLTFAFRGRTVTFSGSQAAALELLGQSSLDMLLQKS